MLQMYSHRSDSTDAPQVQMNSGSHQVDDQQRHTSIPPDVDRMRFCSSCKVAVNADGLLVESIVPKVEGVKRENAEESDRIHIGTISNQVFRKDVCTRKPYLIWPWRNSHHVSRQ